MANYQTLHCTTRGHSHVMRETVCEDHSASDSKGDIHIAVVSDGHGDPACFRSHIGAQAAVEIALENLESFARNIRQQGWEYRLFQEQDREALLRQLIRSIVGNWTLRVMEQLEAAPITEEEYAGSRGYEPLYREGKELPHIFGCTLIAALVTDSYLIVLHQGDGRCVVIHGDGTADQPVPWDDRCVGNICTSLCHTDAVESCRYYVADLRKEPVAGCFVVTDGIEDSLENLEALNAYFCDISSRFVREGEEALLESLERELPRLSQLGSGDDTSFAGIVEPELTALLADRLALIHDLQICGTEERKARSKLNSMQRKMEFLKNELDAAQAEYEAIRSEHHGNSQLLAKLQQELQQFLQRQSDTENQMKAASRRLQEAQEAYREYSATHQSFARMERDAQDEAARIRQKLEQLTPPAVPDRQSEASEPELPDWESPAEILWDPEEEETAVPAQENAGNTDVDFLCPPEEAVNRHLETEEQELRETAEGTQTAQAEQDSFAPDDQDIFRKIFNRILGKNSK